MQIIDVEQNTKEWEQKRKGKILGSRVFRVIPASSGTKEEIIAALDLFKIDYPRTQPRDGSLGKATGNKEVFEALVTPAVQTYLMEQAEKKLEFYQLIADEIAVDWNMTYDENDEIVDYSGTMMQRGHDFEDEGAELFAKKANKKLVQVGICVRDDEEKIGNSPDRLVKPTRSRKKVIKGVTVKTPIYKEAVEVKCLKTAKHLQVLIEKKIPEEYFAQAVQYFVVNEDLETLYFVFYDPRIPYECKLHWIEIRRTDKQVAKLIPQYLAYERVVISQVNQWVEKLAF